MAIRKKTRARMAFRLISSPHDGPTDVEADLVDVGVRELGQLLR